MLTGTCSLPTYSAARPATPGRWTLVCPAHSPEQVCQVWSWLAAALLVWRDAGGRRSPDPRREALDSVSVLAASASMLLREIERRNAATSSRRERLPPRRPPIGDFFTPVAL